MILAQIQQIFHRPLCHADHLSFLVATKECICTRTLRLSARKLLAHQQNAAPRVLQSRMQKLSCARQLQIRLSYHAMQVSLDPEDPVCAFLVVLGRMQIVLGHVPIAR